VAETDEFCTCVHLESVHDENGKCTIDSCSCKQFELLDEDEEVFDPELDELLDEEEDDDDEEEEDDELDDEEEEDDEEG
jgi:hypothetical protein